MLKRYEDMIRQMEREMQRFQQEAFGSLLGGGGLPGRMWQPNVDICESEDCLWVRVEAAGLNLENTRISLSPDNRVLTISGDRPEPESSPSERRRCHQLEVYFGRFQRDILLPDEPLNRDGLRVEYREGFLTVTIPKGAARQVKATTIRVNSR
jgi:HSP20 family molecular chaperone IbpA